MLPRALTRMQQHILYNRVCALAMLHDLVEIALQHIRDLINFRTPFAVEANAIEHLTQFVNKLNTDTREVVDEIERILNLVGNSGSELTERSKLFRLH